MATPQKPTTPDTSGAKRRRSTRLPFSIPITLKGKDSAGNAFEEKTRTLVINKHGTKLTTTHNLTLGAEVAIENPALKRSTKGNVVWVGDEPGPGQAYEAAVELLPPQNIWGIDFPPEDWFEGAPTGSGGQKLQKTPSKDTVQAADVPVPPLTGPGVAKPAPPVATPSHNIPPAEKEIPRSPGLPTRAQSAVERKPSTSAPAVQPPTGPPYDARKAMEGVPSGASPRQHDLPAPPAPEPEIAEPASPVDKATPTAPLVESEIPLPPASRAPDQAATKSKPPTPVPAVQAEVERQRPLEDLHAHTVSAERLKPFEEKLSQAAEQVLAQTERSLREAARSLEANLTASVEHKMTHLTEVLNSTRSQFESLLANFEQLRKSHRTEVEAARHDIKEESSQAVQGAVQSAIEEIRVQTDTLIELAQARAQRSLQKLQEKAAREASEKLQLTTEELADSLAKQLEKHGEDTLELHFEELKTGGNKLADEIGRQLRVATQPGLEALTRQASAVQEKLNQLSEQVSSSTKQAADESSRQLRGLAWATLDSLKADAQATAEGFRREIRKTCEEESAWARDQVVTAARTSLQKMSKDLLETAEAQLRTQTEEALEQLSHQLQEKQQLAVSAAEEMFRGAVAEILETIGRRGGHPPTPTGREPSEPFEHKKPR